VCACVLSQEELREERAARLAQDSAPPPPPSPPSRPPPALDDDTSVFRGAHDPARRTAAQQPTAALSTAEGAEAAVAAAAVDGTLTSARRVIEAIRQDKLVAVHVPDTMLAGVASLRCVPPCVPSSQRGLSSLPVGTRLVSPRAIGARLGHRVSRRRGGGYVCRESLHGHSCFRRVDWGTTCALYDQDCGKALGVSSPRSTLASN